MTIASTSAFNSAIYSPVWNILGNAASDPKTDFELVLTRATDCGDYVNPIATQEPESDCYMPCTKTPTEACGGPNRLNLYYLEGATPATPPATVSTNPGPHGWVSEGCYSDSVGARTLANQVATGDASTMTVALCVDACHTAGYILAGVEYADQCKSSGEWNVSCRLFHALESFQWFKTRVFSKRNEKLLTITF
jgi:hypothetical protein